MPQAGSRLLWTIALKRSKRPSKETDSKKREKKKAEKREEKSGKKRERERDGKERREKQRQKKKENSLTNFLYISSCIFLNVEILI